MFVKRMIAIICILCLCAITGAQTTPKAPGAKKPTTVAKNHKLPPRNPKTGQFMKKAPVKGATAMKMAPGKKPVAKPAVGKKPAAKKPAMKKPAMKKPVAKAGAKPATGKKMPARDPKTGRFMKTPKPPVK
jgi:hypothetical protein